MEKTNYEDSKYAVEMNHVSKIYKLKKKDGKELSLIHISSLSYLSAMTVFLMITALMFIISFYYMSKKVKSENIKWK